MENYPSLAVLMVAGCAVSPNPPDAVIPDNPIHPKSIQFVRYVGNTPPIQLSESERRLPIHAQIRLEQRRFAERELANRGWCANGFDGPTTVTGNESNISLREFTVKCRE